MTKTKNKTSYRRKPSGGHSWIWVLLIILCIVAIVVIIIIITKPQPDIQPEEPFIATPISSNNDTLTTPISTDEVPSEYPEDKVSQYEGGNPNNLEELTGVIIYKSIDNGILTIMATINQYLQQTGSCEITLTGRNYQNSFTTSVNAHADITTSYCENFEIPTNQLATDTYSIEIKITGDGKTGTINDEVEL